MHERCTDTIIQCDTRRGGAVKCHGRVVRDAIWRDKKPINN